MSDMMTFPETWEEFEKSYGFKDSEEVYTNGSRLIPSFRVKQWLDHIAQSETNQQATVSSDCIYRQQAIDSTYAETVSTNPEHFKSSEKFIGFMDDVDISEFGRWQWANGFNTALVATKIQLEKLPSAEKVQLSGEDATFDCISRQDAIDLVESFYKIDKSVLNIMVFKLKQLPSAQPVTHEERTKTHACDLISRQDAVKTMYDACEDVDSESLHIDVIVDALENLPSAELEPMCINLNEPIKVKLTDWGKPIGDGRPLADSEVIPRLQDIKRQIGGSYAIERAIEVLEDLPSASPDLSTFSDKLWKIAYERGKAEGQTEAWEFAIDAYYGTTKEQELFECLTFTQAKTEREELGKCEEKNNAGQIFVELANHINRCINDAVKKTREGEEE